MTEYEMNPMGNRDRRQSGPQVEATLRALASLPAPQDLTGRVHERLRQELTAAQARPRTFWSYWRPAQRMQFATAALLAVGIVGSTFSVYRQRKNADLATPAPYQAPVAAPLPDSGGFGAAGAVRVPPTLHRIPVPPVPHRKPGAGKSAAKPMTKIPTTQPAATTVQQ